ncbi:DUF4862 family protein [Microbacterium sp. NPDC058062]|uniref:DUF4862 family protein n=1 Tax=Microbacterium sp. NPDC058062 TaxID=3346320 RepID=UPI0036DBDF26
MSEATPVLISAYAASPAYAHWDPGLEAELLPALCALPDVAGLEVPWLGAVHPHDPQWFLDHVPAGASLALTPLPWVMRRTAEDPAYGIASTDAAGRAAAIADLRRLRADARLLGERSDGHVAYVALHTAPRGGGDPAALAASLDEVGGWDWGDARLVVEHCDAVRPGQAFEKGFLPLEDEIATIARVDADIGLWLNWGRSAIELRDADAVTTQIRDAAASGILAGLTFSGVATVDGPYGSAWIDAHPPILSTDPSSRSLLDDAHVAAALRAAGDAPWLGLKVSRLPADRTAAEVLATVARNLEVVRRAHATA